MKFWSRILLGIGLALLATAATQAQSLSVSSITVSPGSVRPGDSASFTIGVNNSSTAASFSGTASFTITLTNVTTGYSFNVTATNVSPTATIPAATAGSTTSASTPGTGNFVATVTIPTQTTEAGSYRASVVMTYGASTASFSNSTGILTVTGKPNFRITGLTYAAGTSYVGGNTIPMSVTWVNESSTNGVPNVPYVPATHGNYYRLKFVLSTNATFGDGDDFQLTIQDFASKLDADGATSQQTFSWTQLLPGNFAGSYYVLAKVDAMDQIDENDAPTLTANGDNIWGTNALNPSATLINLLPSNFPSMSLVSRVTSGTTSANAYSDNPTISSDGRYVAFASDASNLIASDVNSARDIFLFDSQTNTARRLSVSQQGAAGNGASNNPAISGNGRYVAFSSLANNLILGDTNGFADIFVVDTITGLISRASVSGAGAQANNPSFRPAISSTGRYIVFESTATNLDSTYTLSAAGGVSHIYLHDRDVSGSGTFDTPGNVSTRLVDVDVNAPGTTAGNASAIQATISGDGSTIAFASRATNLVAPATTGGRQHVYVRARTNVGTATGGMRMIDVVTTTAAEGNGDGQTPSLSNTGRYVAFASVATNLVAGDTNGVSDIFVNDTNQPVAAPTVRRVSISSTGVQAVDPNGSGFQLGSINPTISSTGRFVAFASLANNLTPGDRIGQSQTSDSNSALDIFVHDRDSNATGTFDTTFTTQLASVNTFGYQTSGVLGAPSTAANNIYPVISADGRFVALPSDAENNGGLGFGATNQLPLDSNSARDIFLFDRRTITTINSATSPSVSITSPGNNSSALVNTAVTLTASATTTVGVVSSVQFFVNGTSVGTSTVFPYTAVWTPTAVGTYTLSALVTDSFGNIGGSTNVAVTINAAPSVGITSPTAAATITAGTAQTITAVAGASNPGATISSVQFFVNGSALSTDTTSPYTASWTPAAAGAYVLTAVATDSIGTQSTSAAVNLTVTAAGGGGTTVTPPTVAIASPTTGSTVTVNTTQTVTATATATGGTVTQVAFFANGVALGIATSFPYTVPWTPATPGTYAITATATDHRGVQATSGAANITVVAGTGPTVALVTPVGGTTVTAGTPQTISANASAGSGNIVSVVFTANGVVVATDTAFPYTAPWTPGGPGTYTISAIATDSTGNQTTSSITVTATGTLPAAPTVSLTAPIAGSSLIVNNPHTLVAAASSAGSTVAKVDFYANNVLIGSDTTFPYSLAWTPTAIGNYALTVVAVDQFGSQTTSAPVAVSVAAGSSSQPSIFLTSPANGVTLSVNNPVFVSATAEDPDGVIAGVEFYANGVAIGSSATAPYFTAWVPSAVGSYAITAVATDSVGNRVTSVAANITVAAVTGRVPVATLQFNHPTVDTATGPSATPAAPSTTPVQVSFGSKLILSAGAVDQDGTITNVQFFANGTSIASVNAEPFTTVWDLNTLSNVVLTAVVSDSSGNRIATNPIVIETVPSTAAAASSVALVSPRDNNAYVAGGQIIFSATHNFGSVVPPKIDFYVNGTQFTTVSAPPYQAVLGLTRAGNYTIHAVGRSGSITTVSTPSRIVVTSNSAPTVAITSPASGTTSVVGTGLTIASSANDPDGTIRNVQFFVNGAVLSSDDTVPYTATWNPGAAGIYSLTALATDNAGNQSLSAPVVVTLSGNGAPQVALSAPANGTVATAGTAITLTASASDADGTVTGVRFLANGIVVGNAAAAPFSAAWTPSAAGSYTVIAQATDNSGNVTSSSAVSVVISANGAPTVALTAPSNGASIRVGTSVNVTGTATDSDGTITSVQFLANGTPIGTADTTAPYAATWTPPAEGVYRLSALALDNSGASATSTTVTVVVVGANAGDQVYFGSYAGAAETGRFALIRSASAGAFIAYSNFGSPRTYFMSGLSVDTTGAFTRVDAAGRPILTGSTSDTGVSGALDGRLTFIGPATIGGASPVPPGYYSGNLNGRMGSTLAVIVAADGNVMAYVADGTFNDAGAGTIGAGGAFNLSTAGGGRIAGTIDPASGFVTGSLTGGPGGGFTAALASGVSISDGFLRNLSTRGQVGSGANILIAGFVVGGTSAKQVLVRAIGPSLTQFGVTGTLSDPNLQVFSGSTLVAANDNWRGEPALVAASAQAGGFPLAASSLDSALLLTLQPGSYTAQVSGIGAATGVALVELYDIDNLSPFSAQKVLNVATRGVVGTGQAQLIAGFTVSGNTPKKILVRGIGPTLGAAPFNVPGALADPVLSIVRSDGRVVRENDNWESGNDAMLVSGAAAKVSAFALPAGSRDAAILMSLPPGAYTAQVVGAGTGTGVALVEVYEIP